MENQENDFIEIKRLKIRIPAYFCNAENDTFIKLTTKFRGLEVSEYGVREVSVQEIWSKCFVSIKKSDFVKAYLNRKNELEDFHLK
jgi:hypothetical protein